MISELAWINKKMSAILRIVSPFLKPSLYTNYFWETKSFYHKKVLAGSIEPLFHAMIAVGVIGYTVEYVGIGRKLLYIE